MRGMLRRTINEKLVLLSGDAHASMRWTVKGYHRKIYTEYGLALVGWPDDMVFTNLSDPELTGYRRISALYMRWQVGTLTFVPVELGKDERAAQNPMDVAPNVLNKGVPLRLGRSDLKKHRGSRKVDPARFPARYVRNGPKSARWVTPEMEARAEMELARLGGGGKPLDGDAQGSEDPSDPICSFSEDESATEAAAVVSGGTHQGCRASGRVVLLRTVLRME
ncbi:hypothetical protein OH77DRAFT_493145 [Trametes cingulata]|nr:hypothetical protein OH77DRAFT_493145 [Trametes cingulata]